MKTPDGHLIVWLARNDGSGQVEAALHASLDNGWTIERISTDSIDVVQTQSKERATIPLPLPPAANN